MLRLAEKYILLNPYHLSSGVSACYELLRLAEIFTKKIKGHPLMP
ncbi:protein of unknown function [Shewanella benthica]|uniref:Uncharacterized protein n=1 Tax=Shewanella benthica TaxID=43661 RepID=A0A330LZ03_9GAMM|nr:protein of unknown function [Shewanella benthica]